MTMQREHPLWYRPPMELASNADHRILNNMGTIMARIHKTHLALVHAGRDELGPAYTKVLDGDDEAHQLPSPDLVTSTIWVPRDGDEPNPAQMAMFYNLVELAEEVGNLIRVLAALKEARDSKSLSTEQSDTLKIKEENVEQN